MFRKILLWFIGIFLFSFVGFVLTSVWSNQRGIFRNDMMRRMHQHVFREAVEAYERGGGQALAHTLETQNRDFPARHYLLDSAGRDLATSEDRSKLLSQASERPRFRLPPPPHLLIRRPSPDGKYIYLIEVESRADPLSDLAVYSWLIAAVVALCYALAYTLVRPIRHLRSALTRFGQGDLNARSELRRRDELGDLSHAFDDMAGRISTLLTAERRLLQDVSHELRSPLTRLRFAVQLARSSPDPRAQLDRVDREAERVATLVGDLLQVTRAEGDPESRNREQIDLEPFIEEIVEDCRLEAAARSCSLDFKALDSPRLTGDRELIRRAVENIVRNAIHYSPAGAAVSVEVRSEADDIVIEVRDAGPGVPLDALEKIFQPFYRVEQDRSRDNGGVGLGLAIARRAVTAHGGAIRARHGNPGLVVEVRLPR